MLRPRTVLAATGRAVGVTPVLGSLAPSVYGAESVAVRRGVSRGHWHDVVQTGTYSLCTKREIVIMVDGKPV